MVATTDEDRRRVLSEHFKYEINMLVSTHNLMKSSRGQFPVEIHNAVIESFLVHVRVLRDFFTADKVKHKDDAIAKHYAPAYKVQPATRATLKEFDTRVNAQVMHLSYRRRGGWELKFDDTGIDAVVKALVAEAGRLRDQLDARFKPHWTLV